MGLPQEAGAAREEVDRLDRHAQSRLHARCPQQAPRRRGAGRTGARGVRVDAGATGAPSGRSAVLARDSSALRAGASRARTTRSWTTTAPVSRSSRSSPIRSRARGSGPCSARRPPSSRCSTATALAWQSGNGGLPAVLELTDRAPLEMREPVRSLVCPVRLRRRRWRTARPGACAMARARPFATCSCPAAARWTSSWATG